ncbi:hypothetical protein [Paraburkholderia sp. BL21I4N1]|uniref:hypothetical protein n=1 Tax=Paraburkholderia sp. BL21I4N1 TaxID=1938801 RepID=UPI000CFB59EF|nr:hypothetical protein [Paraburkholderia sp. BL21I4N1]PQV49203.1 hypothetical protein B0G83_107148 [Paraburkholderia sp. BL21I4N1]
MKLSTTVRLRAYLVTASMSAVVIQVGALVSICAFGVPEAYFQTPTFRLVAAGAICAMVFGVATISPMAFRSAVARRYAIHDDNLRDHDAGFFARIRRQLTQRFF